MGRQLGYDAQISSHDSVSLVGQSGSRYVREGSHNGPSDLPERSCHAVVHVLARFRIDRIHGTLGQKQLSDAVRWKRVFFLSRDGDTRPSLASDTGFGGKGRSRRGHLTPTFFALWQARKLAGRSGVAGEYQGKGQAFGGDACWSTGRTSRGSASRDAGSAESAPFLIFLDRDTLEMLVPSAVALRHGWFHRGWARRLLDWSSDVDDV